MRRKRSLGKAFSDAIIKTSRHQSVYSKLKDADKSADDLFTPFYEGPALEYVSSWRLVIVASIFVVAFVSLFVRLAHLQVVKGQDNRELADSNRIRVKVIHAPRGVIYDRNNQILAQNNPGYRLYKKFLPREEALAMEVKKDPNFEQLEIDTVRYYPLKEAASHLLGYVGEITEEELKDPLYKDYKLGDRIGRSGIEQVYERLLRGKDGAEIVEVDAQGKKLQVLRKIDPIPGQNVHLAIDSGLQKHAFESLKQEAAKSKSCCGAVVAQDPKTGEVLALASYPSFDANAFNDPKRGEEVSGYFNDSNSPLLNRVIGGAYPPGSTFKIASSLAGLSSGKITEQTQIEDTGIMYLGTFSFANWYFTQHGGKDGLVDVVKALQRSNDIYYYKLGHEVGEEEIGKAAQKMGMGKRLGIDLPGEIDGLIPNDAWKRKTFEQPWYPGDTLHMSIGQGFLLATPLQVLGHISFIASDGKLYQPHLAKKVSSTQGATIKEFKFDPIVKDVFKKEHIDLVKKGLSLVPKPGGTAWPFFNFTVPTAGKTGTAEFGDPKNKTHAWYAAYAPEDDPKIAAVSLLEAGGEGSTNASPIVKQVFTWYFNEDKSNLKSLDAVPVSTESAKKLGE